MKTGLQKNKVNADVRRPGVYLLQADRARQLDSTHGNPEDAGDPMPGVSGKLSIDNSTTPATSGNFSLCNVRIAADAATFDIRISPKCPN